MYKPYASLGILFPCGHYFVLIFWHVLKKTGHICLEQQTENRSQKTKNRAKACYCIVSNCASYDTHKQQRKKQNKC